MGNFCGISGAPGQSNQQVPEGWRRGACRPPGQHGLDAVEVPDLMRPGAAFPVQLWRGAVTHVVEPRPLTRSVAVGALPYLTRPAVRRTRPTEAIGPHEAMGRPRIARGWVLKDAAPCADGAQRGRETSTVVAGPVVLATPTLVIEGREVHPQVARRVGHHGVWACIESCVARDVPGVHIREPDIGAASIYEKRCNHGVAWGCRSQGASRGWWRHYRRTLIVVVTREKLRGEFRGN